MKRVFTLVMVFGLFVFNVSGQIQVRKLNEGEEAYFRDQKVNKKIAFDFPEKQKILEDLVTKGKTIDIDEEFKFSSIQNLGIDFDSFEFNCYDGTCRKVLQIKSEEAVTLAFLFEELKLAPKSRIYIYSEKHGYLQGEIIAEDLQRSDGVISSLMPGDEVKIILETAEEEIKDNTVKISQISHGIFDFFGILEGDATGSRMSNVLGYGDAPACIRNIACEPTLSTESKAVALVATWNYPNQSYRGTAALVNNGNQDRRAIVLTAGHVYNTADYPNNIQLIFHYKSPQCSPTSASLNHISFQGVNQLSATVPATDSKLLEMQVNPRDSPLFASYPVSWLGWSIVDQISSKVKIIGHPDADVQKYIEGSSPVAYTHSGSYYYWKFNFTDGFPIVTSSGSPVFDASHRVIGPYHGKVAGPLYGCGLVNENGLAGRLSKSWSVFSQYLDPLNQGLVALNTISTSSSTTTVPYLSGPDVLCNSNTVFNLNNAPVGIDIPVSWEIISGSSLVTPTSGTGKTATLSKSSASAGGVIQLRFKVEFPGNTKYYYKSITVGSPPAGAISGGTYVYTYHILTYSISPVAGATSYNWQLPSGWTGGGTGLGNSITVTVGPTGGNVTVTPVNACGMGQSSSLYVTVNNCQTCRGVSFSPNPANTYVEVMPEDSDFEQLTLRKYELYDLNGKLMKSEAIDAVTSLYRIQVSDIPKGVYVIHLYFDEEILVKRLIVDR